MSGWGDAASSAGGWVTPHLCKSQGRPCPPQIMSSKERPVILIPGMVSPVTPWDPYPPPPGCRQVSSVCLIYDQKCCGQPPNLGHPDGIQAAPLQSALWLDQAQHYSQHCGWIRLHHYSQHCGWIRLHHYSQHCGWIRLRHYSQHCGWIRLHHYSQHCGWIRLSTVDQ